MTKAKIEPVERTISPGYCGDGVGQYTHNIASARLARQSSTRQFKGMTLSHRIFVIEQGLKELTADPYPTAKQLRDIEAKRKFLRTLKQDLIAEPS